MRTQAPYALLTMTIALGLGYGPCALYGISPWIVLPLDALLLVGVLRVLGRRRAEPDPALLAAADA